MYSSDPAFATSFNIIAFRRIVADMRLPIPLFIDTIMELYGEFSDAAAHNVRLPTTVDESTIMEMLTYLRLVPDYDRVKTVEALLKPIWPSQPAVNYGPVPGNNLRYSRPSGQPRARHRGPSFGPYRSRNNHPQPY